MVSGIGAAVSSLATQLGAQPVASPAQGAGASFTDVFQSAVKDVDSLQNNADQQIAGMVQGAGNADIGQTMVSVEKADIAFQLMMQVRNKVVSAYQELDKMQF
jgi:flagellar hook-basal body complex protein FliE